MYLLDYKHPKYLSVISDKLFKEFSVDLKIRDNKQKMDKAYKAVCCFVYNCSFVVGYNKHEIPITLKEEHYSKPLIYNAVVIHRKVSYTYSKLFFEWLHSTGKATLNKGYVEEWGLDNGILVPRETSISTIVLGDELIQMFKEITNKQKTPTLCSVVEVRDGDGNIITKRLPEYQKVMITILNNYNLLTRKCTITVDDIEYNIQLKKVYNNSSWELGGRNYVTGDTSIMTKTNRKQLKINGEDTVELDYSALHPRIAATLNGVRLPKDFDPYAITLKEYDPKISRYFGKWATLILLNIGLNVQHGKLGLVRARLALATAVKEDGKLKGFIEEGLCPKYIDYDGIIREVVSRNQYIHDWFMNEPKGLTLQNYDSRMIDMVIGHFNSMGEIIIPVHDSVVVRKSLQQECYDAMIGTYKQILGSDTNCVVNVK